MELSQALSVRNQIGLQHHHVRAFVHDDEGVLIGEAYCDEKEAFKYVINKSKAVRMTYDEVMQLDWMVQ